MNSRRLAVLATCPDGFPYTCLVGFAFSEDLKEIYFATFENTRKFRNITAHPGVSMLVDSRENSQSDFGQAKALTILGRAKSARGPEKEKIKISFLRRFPRLEGFVTDPACAMVKITPEKYILVERFQEVTEWEIKS